MAGTARPIRLLVADDDEDDWEFIADALHEVGANRTTFVHDGQDLLDYLRRDGVYADRPQRDDPDLVILDLKMPRMTGAEVLSEIRADPSLLRIPVLVLTTSTSEDEVNDSYERGANSVISKPASFTQLVGVLRGVREYWGNIVNLPGLAPGLVSRSAVQLPVAGPAGIERPPPARRRFARLRLNDSVTPTPE